MNPEMFSTQIGAAAALSFLLQWLKGSSWFPWISTQTAKVNRFAAIIGSGLVSFGIHATWNSTDHSLLLTGLYWQTILLGLGHWFVQFCITHGWYKVTNPPQGAK